MYRVYWRHVCGQTALIINQILICRYSLIFFVFSILIINIVRFKIYEVHTQFLPSVHVHISIICLDKITQS